MTISMFNASVPVFIRMLGNLQKILEKAAAFADSKRVDSKVLAAYRLAPDMLPLSAQIQIILMRYLQVSIRRA